MLGRLLMLLFLSINLCPKNKGKIKPSVENRKLTGSAFKKNFLNGMAINFDVLKSFFLKHYSHT
jgi:hypothetical protein